MTIAQRMAKMSRKIDKWLKSLDGDEEGEMDEEGNDNNDNEKSGEKFFENFEIKK